MQAGTRLRCAVNDASTSARTEPRPTRSLAQSLALPGASPYPELRTALQRLTSSLARLYLIASQAPNSVCVAQLFGANEPPIANVAGWELGCRGLFLCGDQ